MSRPRNRTRIAITEHAAAYSLWVLGYTMEQIQAFIVSKRGTCADGYIYADEIPTHL